MARESKEDAMGTLTVNHQPPPAVELASPFRVDPLPGGFAPGVDPLRLNQLNDELEVQEYEERESR